MAVTLLTRVHRGATKRFTVTIEVGGEVVSIIGDTVTLSLAHQDKALEHSFTANVDEFGSIGIAVFLLTAEQTDALEPGIYRAEVVWKDDSEVNVVTEGFISVVELLYEVEA